MPVHIMNNPRVITLLFIIIAITAISYIRNEYNLITQNYMFIFVMR